MGRTKKKGRTTIKRLPPCHNRCFIFGWFLFLLTLVALLVLLAVDAVMGGSQLYLYRKETDNDNDGGSGNNGGDADDDLPVLEHMRLREGGDNYGNEVLRPDFLYPPAAGGSNDEEGSALPPPPPPRVVEFYAPWCGHCQKFAPKYLKLAGEVTATHPEVKFYAVSCVAHKELCKAQGVKSYPTIKYFKEGSYNSTTVKRHVFDVVVKELGLEPVEPSSAKSTTTTHDPGGVHHKSNENDREFARVVPFRRHDVHDAWSDASLSFEYALKNGIYMENGPLAEEKADALREWLELLSKSLPYEMKRTHSIVQGLLEDFGEVKRGSSYLNQAVGRRASEPEWSWRTCTYGDNEVGYTCGLWQLFHVMSVGVVEYNRHNPPIPTGHAAETLRNYIDHFFQCDVCRINFLSAYDSCALDGCHRLSEDPSTSEHEWRQLPLWLWETHNDVNVRLMGERLEQEKLEEASEWESQQSLWPPLFSCPNCWRADHSWDESEVFDHLHDLYWSGSPSYIRIPSGDGVADSGHGSSSPLLPWKLSVVAFAVAVLVMHMSKSKNGRRNSGKHKK